MSPTESSHFSYTTIQPPAVKIQRATPEAPQQKYQGGTGKSPKFDSSTPRRVHFLSAKHSTGDKLIVEHRRKRSTTSVGLLNPTTRQKMASWKSQSPESAASPDSATSPPRPTKKAKPNPKDVDWADVTDPEERRRIQNRIAQRKFREYT
jgi:hypothetical protein